MVSLPAGGACTLLCFLGSVLVVSGHVLVRKKTPQLDWIGGFDLPRKLWPEAMKGKNIVFGGDSNDRKFMWSLCQTYNAPVKSFSTMHESTSKSQTPSALRTLTWMSDSEDMNQTGIAKDVGLAKGIVLDTSRSRLAVPRMCHLQEFNASLLYLYHPGVMSIAPRPEWHRVFLEFPGNVHRRIEFSPRIDGHIGFASSDLLAGKFWKKAIEEHLPRRPIIFILQSSAWDSQPAFESQKLEQDVLSRKDLDQWNWLDRASQFLKVVQTTFDNDGDSMPVERVCWRTNSNCPWSAPSALGVFRRHPVSNISKFMAEEVRDVVGKHPPWKDVCLIDWDAHYSATKEDDCAYLHYKTDGYAGYMSALWEAFRE